MQAMTYQLNKIYSDYDNVHEICREVLDVSNKSNIDAVLIGGSLLGIVRDGDFLPWDKDLDFAVFESEINDTLALEPVYRDLGYECRVHSLGIRSEQSLSNGLSLLKKICQQLEDAGMSYQLINGVLLNLYRDGVISPETDGLSILLNITEQQNDQLNEVLKSFGTLYQGHNRDGQRNMTLVCKDWRFFFFHYKCDKNGFGWDDLNCEHRFSQPLFPSCKIKITEFEWSISHKAEALLSSRFGANWHEKPKPSFTEGRVSGSMQLFKQGVMFDFIFHYVRGEKTYWFEPKANVISTRGFIPYSMRKTTAGEMLLPEHPEVFLEEHYPNWQVPVKSWNGAVDNPTIVPSDFAMQKIIHQS